MKESKEKDLRLKEKPLSFQPSGAVRDAGRVVKLMKDRCQRERGREQQEREPGAAASAAEQMEDYAADAISAASSVVGKGADQIYRVMRRHRQAEPGEETGQELDAAPPPPPSEAMQQAAVQEMGESVRTGGTEPDTEARPSVPAREKPSFVPREKQLPIRERPAREYRENIQSISVPHFSGVRAETEPVSSAPSPGERMKQAAIREQKKRALRGAAQPEPQSASAADMPSFPSEVFPDAPRRVPPGSPAPERLAAETRAPADRPFPIPRQGPRTPTEPGRSAAVLRERPACLVPAIKTRQAAERTKLTGTAAVSKAEAASGTGPKAANRVRAVGGAAKPAVSRTARSRARQLAVDRTKQAARTTASLGKRAAQAVAHTASSLVSALAGLIGGGALLLILCGVLLVGAVVASPFGIFLAGQEPKPGTVSPNGAIAQVNIELTDYLVELQIGDYADIQLQGQLPDWQEVLAVFAVQTALSEDGVDVVTLDAGRVERLKDVFWDMTTIIAETEVWEDSGEAVLRITVEARTAGDMRELYGFTDDQNAALDGLLAETELLDGLITDLSISQADAAALVAALPEDLDPMRRAVVETACSLVGKVNYFWGGKSLALGWDDRWGQVEKIVAEGSPTTGTYRPFGMDCSGFVDWVFYNITGGKYIIGHGGGAMAQHSYCIPILWSEAQPGDLVFYPEDVHVGIVGGRDEGGRLLIVHCASGANNVAITGTNGFTSIGRPVFFNQ